MGDAGRGGDHWARRHRVPGRVVGQPGWTGDRAWRIVALNEQPTGRLASSETALPNDPSACIRILIPPMHETYENPLITRYASREMATLWGDQRKFSTWRRLWVALAEAEAELGLPITQEQIAELRAHTDDIDFDAAEQYERKLRHDVMAHVHAYGDQCPTARPIIHLGATSCYVTDNTDLILIRESLQMVARRLAAVIVALADFAKQYRDLPTLSFTHLQPAQPTTVGRRACLWAYDLVLDLAEVEHRIDVAEGPQRERARPARRPAFWSCSTATTTRCGSSSSSSPRRWASTRRTPSPGKRIRARSTPRCSTRWPASRPAATRRRPTCASWPIARKSKSRSRRIRSAPRRWPTSGTRCGASGFAGWPGSR